MTERLRIIVEGVVQGVGFRPFVYRLAARNRLAGFVLNDTGGVTIELEGERPALERFVQSLEECPPPLASIERIVLGHLPPAGEKAFAIAESRPDLERSALISADTPTCEACLRELFDPNDRRHRYPFINCSHCGPRFTIVRDVPYDRERTTMAAFRMCEDCAREYHDPADRRFHAEPNACPKCGPRLCLLDAGGDAISGEEPIRAAAGGIRRGAIVAIKGLGGYHLACDASSEAAVARLRRGKHRADKPFALMAADVDRVREFCFVSAAEEALLTSRRRPIALLRRRASGDIAAAVAPGRRDLGFMLPYTPLHHLLLRECGGPLVMTSGNASDEPIAYRDADARERLGAIADLFLCHDREIHARCDDSVARSHRGRELVLRRARGYAPEPLAVRRGFAEPTLGCGAHLKNAFCLGKGARAFLSQHIGDLESYEAFRAFAESIEHFERLFDIRPTVVAHDLHPEYLSTKYAMSCAGVARVAVQHHHAHIASCMAEHSLEGPVIGVAFDGLGYGPDGTMWGGEFLIAELAGFERRAHLREVALAGGEAAIREPWRAALSYLDDACEIDPSALPGWKGIAPRRVELVRKMRERGVNTIRASSCGRLFDAVASILGLRHRVSYEGHAAAELEMAAADGLEESYPFALGASLPWELDMRPAVRAIARDALEGKAKGAIAARFHNTLAEAVVEVCRRIREREGLRRVCLSGGVFQNAYLLERATRGLEAARFEVYSHSRVPPNDGGISLGQAVIANELVRRGLRCA